MPEENPTLTVLRLQSEIADREFNESIIAFKPDFIRLSAKTVTKNKELNTEVMKCLEIVEETKRNTRGLKTLPELRKDLEAALKSELEYRKCLLESEVST